jgi:hypothetical protein
LREVVFALAVVGAEREVHDVGVVGDVPVAVRIEREVDGLQQSDAAAARRDRAADLDRQELGARGHAFGGTDARDDVRHMAPVSAGARRRDGRRPAVDRIRIRRGADLGVTVRVLTALVGVGIRPGFTDEVEAADHLARRKEAVGRRVLRIGRGRAVRGLVRVDRAGTAEVAMGVVDARVQHSHRHACAVDSCILECGGADVRHGLAQIGLVVADRLHGLDARQGRDVLELGGVDRHEDGVERLRG